MAQASTRQGLIDYCLRQLGAPVLEINVADEQIDDLVDDALQYFHERHFDGVEKMYLKYKITQADLDRGRAKASHQIIFKFQTQLLELKKFLNLIRVQFLLECLVLNINYS